MEEKMEQNRLQQEIEVLLMMSEGEITPEIDELMKKQLRSDNLEQNLAWLLMKYEVNEALVKVRSERLETVKKKVESSKRTSEYWKNQIANELLRNDTQSIRLKEYDLSFRKSESVEIYREEEIPEEYLVVKTTKSPDKTAIKAAIKSGIKVPGAILEVNQNLQIKS